MGKCELCGSEGSRLQVNHKEHGRMMVCRDCWKEVNEKGQRISEGTSGSSDGSSCPACSF